jgi:copper resistance protein C
MSAVRRSVQALLAACIGLGLATVAAPASAHTDLVAGSPGPNEVLRTPAGELSLTFASALLPEGTQILVRDPGGVDRAVGAAVSGSSVGVQIKPLTRAGRYTVAYRAVAVDGHPVTGSYQFTVSPAAASAAATQPVTDASTQTVPSTGGTASTTEAPRAAVSAPSTPTWVIGGLGAATLAALLWIGAGRRTLGHETKKR